MPYFIGLIAIVGGVVYFLYRLSLIYSVGKEVAGDSKALFRRTRWNFKRRYDPLDDLTDPREVATVLMLETAKMAGEMTVSQKARINQLMRNHFQISTREADEMMLSAAYITREIADIENVLVKILRPVRERLTETERLDLLQMLRDVAAADGKTDDYQRRFIAVVKDKLVGPGARNFA